MEIIRTLTIEATHELGANVAGRTAHPYGGLHGHSIAIELTARLAADDAEARAGAALERAAGTLHRRLDHQWLNRVPGLETPTLETLARWIWAELGAEVPGLARVSVRRPSLGEGAICDGP